MDPDDQYLAGARLPARGRQIMKIHFLIFFGQFFHFQLGFPSTVTQSPVVLSGKIQIDFPTIDAWSSVIVDVHLYTPRVA